jgi:hypothetical protein
MAAPFLHIERPQTTNLGNLLRGRASVRDDQTGIPHPPVQRILPMTAFTLLSVWALLRNCRQMLPESSVAPDIRNRVCRLALSYSGVGN